MLAEQKGVSFGRMQASKKTMMNRVGGRAPKRMYLGMKKQVAQEVLQQLIDLVADLPIVVCHTDGLGGIG